MTTLEKIGRRILKAREAQKMTQQQLAKKLGCSRVNVCLMETGKSGTATTKIPALCRALRISADHLFGLAKN